MATPHDVTERITNISIAITVIVIAITASQLFIKLADNSRATEYERRQTQMEKIRACSKTSQPALCLAATK